VRLLTAGPRPNLKESRHEHATAPERQVLVRCGEPTASFFAPGHDRRTEAAIVKGVSD
jgi:hypothetical protein